MRKRFQYAVAVAAFVMAAIPFAASAAPSTAPQFASEEQQHAYNLCRIELQREWHLAGQPGTADYTPCNIYTTNL